jgi:glycosyltransferase involved in cell wall biosynthesis
VRIAIFHNRYAQRGGEDSVVETEAELLRKAGCEVRMFTVDSAPLLASRSAQLRAALEVRWNPSMVERVTRFLAAHPADVAHVHNFFPLLSPSVHATLRSLGVPVVQTLHNYRLVCANGVFLRDEKPCEECAVRGPWRAVRYGCWRGSRMATAVWAEATAAQRRWGSWLASVDRFVVPSEFARRKLAAAGLPPERIVVKPNPVPDPGEPAPPGRGAVYVGRLSPEKGLALLLDAWRTLPGAPSLTIAGGGPDESRLRERARGIPGVSFLGEVARDRVPQLFAGAAFAVAPSIWFEVFGVTVAEAMAAGRAVVASDIHGYKKVVQRNVTGLLVEPKDPDALCRAMAQLINDPALRERLGEAGARRATEFDWQHVAKQLVGVYEEVLSRGPSSV